MKQFTNDGQHFYMEGDHINNHYCLTEGWYQQNGYGLYTTRQEDGTDGLVQEGSTLLYIHYLGAPVAPQPDPEPTEDEIAARAEAERIAGIQAEIATHKAAITETDYIITKCMEAQLMGEESPYDADYLEGIHIARQAHRDRINQLEEELA